MISRHCVAAASALLLCIPLPAQARQVLQGHVSKGEPADQNTVPPGVVDNPAVGDLNRALSIELEVKQVDSSAEELWNRSAPIVAKNLPECYAHYQRAHDLVPSLQQAYRAHDVKTADAIVRQADSERTQGYRCASQPRPIQPRSSGGVGQRPVVPLVQPNVTPLPKPAVPNEQPPPGQSGFYPGFTSATSDPSQWQPPPGTLPGDPCQTPNAQQSAQCRKLTGRIDEAAPKPPSQRYDPPRRVGVTTRTADGSQYLRVVINGRRADFRIGNDDSGAPDAPPPLPGQPRYTRVFTRQRLEPPGVTPSDRIVWSYFWGVIARDKNGPGSGVDGLLITAIEDSKGQRFVCNFTLPLDVSLAVSARRRFSQACTPERNARNRAVR